MKKAISAILAAALIMSQLALCAEAAVDNPLAVSDKVTEDVAQLKERQEKIENERRAMQSASKAQVAYGKSTSNTNDLSFYINRKYLTKREYEAFKWSFIFGQFARPLEDSLLDVFYQEFFNQMVEKDFSLESVRNSIINSGLVADSDNSLNSDSDFGNDLDVMMLQSVNFNELVEVINANYSIYPLVDGNGNRISFEELVTADMGLYETLYIYDTKMDAGKNVDYYNALIYNQDELGKNNSSLSIEAESVLIPMLFYDSSTYLYMQLAVSAYLKNNNLNSINDIYAEFGNNYLAADSFGNICVINSNGKAVIFIPNFGNTVLMNTVDPDAASERLQSTINLYNTWFTSQYSHSTRNSTTIYPNEYTVTLNGAVSVATNTNDGTVTVGSQSVKSDHYSAYLKEMTGASLANSYVLVENSLVDPVNFFTDEHMASLGNDPFESVKDGGDVNDTFSHATIANAIGQCLSENTSIVGTLADSMGMSWLSKLRGTDAAAEGTLVSPYNSHCEYFAPFTATDGASRGVFENKYPLIQAEVDTFSADGTNPSDYTVYSRASASLTNGVWKFSVSSVGTHAPAIATVYSSGWAKKTAENDNSILSAVNPTVSLVSNLEADELIPDLRFCSFYKGTLDDGTNRAIIYLPADILDLGQDMSAYKLSDEKGMFVAAHDIFFSSDLERFKQYMNSLYKQLFVAHDCAKVVDYDNGKMHVHSTKKLNDTAVTDKSYFELYWGAEVGSSALVTDDSFWEYIALNQPKGNNAEAFSITKKYVIATKHEKGDDTYSLSNNPPSEDDENRYIYATYYYDSNFVSLSLDNKQEPKVTYGKNSDFDSRKVSFGSKCLKAVVGIAANSTYSSTAGFRKALSQACDVCGFDTDEVYHMLVNIYRYNGSDNKANATNNVYFYDEYTYTMRNGANLSDKIGCNNSSDFVEAVYFWDRHYLTKASFNRYVEWFIRERLYPQIEQSVEAYNELLEKTFQTSLQYTFADYMDDYGDSALSVGRGHSDIYMPFAYEYTLQPQSYAEWARANTNTVRVLGETASLYEYLTEDTIILYPFGWEDYSKQITLYSGLGDTIGRASSSAAKYKAQIDAARTNQSINPIQVILALQKNTDYTNNTLSVTYTRTTEPTHVTRGELMDNANEFFTNPVSSLSYIISGFLYKVHESVALGELGSVFSINFLLESDIYQFIINRYIAIVTIALVLILFLKLIQFAMNKSKDFAHIGKSIIGILAMCLVPVIVFNSFVWAFDVSSAWALRDSTNKILLAQIDTYAKNQNADGNVEAEKNAFREQLSSLTGVYDCIQMQQLANYAPGLDPVYDIVPISEMIRNTTYTVQYKDWYKTTGFVPVHESYYDDSYFYFFYDYIKSEFLQYCSTNNVSAVSNFASVFDSVRGGNSVTLEDQKAINAAENSLRSLTGNFRQMLLDTKFVYSNSVYEEQAGRYGGPQAKDLVGLYIIFDNSVIRNSELDSVISSLQGSVYFRAALDSDLMVLDKTSIMSPTWFDTDIIEGYIESEIALRKGIRGAYSSTVYTSRLDAYNRALNSEAANVDASRESMAPILTPLEEKLCAMTTDIYDTTLAALNYLPSQVHDEAAICLMAYIATFKFNEVFGLEGSEPLLESVYLDTVVRTAFVRNLSEVGSNTNTLYSMVNQGDSVGKVAMVVALEIIIMLASVLRVIIIVYITISSFIILALRLLHKAPRTTDLAYGIIGNMLALLFLHALTLFLVVIAVEWVASATSAIPGFLLDIIMILFTITVSIFLFKVVSNIIRDAINLGGTKIKAGVHKIADAVMSIAGRIGIGQSSMELESATINVGTPDIMDQLDEMKAAEEERARRTEEVITRLREVEAEEEQRAQESNNLSSPQNTHEQALGTRMARDLAAAENDANQD